MNFYLMTSHAQVSTKPENVKLRFLFQKKKIFHNMYKIQKSDFWAKYSTIITFVLNSIL